MKVIQKIAWAIILFLGSFSFTDCNRIGSLPVNETQYDFKVKHYDQYYEIDPDINIFKSKQKIVLINVSKTQTDKVVFSIHPNLVIDQILLKDTVDRQIKVKNRKLIGTRKWSDLSENDFSIIEIQLFENINPNQKITFSLDYHLRPEAIADVPKNNICLLTVTPKVSYAIGPFTGNNPIFGRNLAAPFELSIKYPEGNLSCVPGQFISSKKDSGYVIDKYSSKISNIPTFACAPYEKIVRKKGDVAVEFYLYPRQKYTKEMIDYTFKVVDLYFNVFGYNGTSTYRFGTVGKINATHPGGENKGNAIYLTDLVTKNYLESKEGKGYYKYFVNHEIFHNWNLFYVHWSGKLYEWFGEGGANFISAWAAERVIGAEAGAQARKLFIKQYIKNKGYKAGQPLESVRKTGKAERALIYGYGALVWEQLRQKLGDEAFFAGLGNFYKQNGFKDVNYQNLLENLQAHTTVNVESYLNQWIEENAKIKLSVDDVEIQKKNGFYQTDIEISVSSDKNYELFTSIGYKTASQTRLQTVPVHVSTKGNHRFTLNTEQKPVYIQLDPYFKVPRINLDNCEWVSK
jgi:hypothetical protein